MQVTPVDLHQPCHEPVRDLIHERDSCDLPDEHLQEIYVGDPLESNAQNACVALWLRHEQKLRRQALRSAFNDEDLAEEGLSETKLKVLHPDTRKKYDPNRPWVKWTAMVLHHEVIQVHRRRAGLAAIPIDWTHESGSSAEDPAEVVAQIDYLDKLSSDVTDGLRGLSEEEQQFLRLVFFEGMSQTAAVKQLGRSPSWGSRHAPAVLARMQQFLEQKGYGEQS